MNADQIQHVTAQLANITDRVAVLHEVLQMDDVAIRYYVWRRLPPDTRPEARELDIAECRRIVRDVMTSVPAEPAYG